MAVNEMLLRLLSTARKCFGYGSFYGYQEDEGGLKQLGHRLYDPVAGRFVTKDPIKDGRNWYAYCDNNPLTSADPSGLATITIRISQQGLGHCWIIIRWDDGEVWVLQITLTGNVEIMFSGDDDLLKMLARDYDTERTVVFDEEDVSKGSLLADALDWLGIYNFCGNNCVDFSTFIWKLVTGEDLRGSVLGVGTPGATEKKVEEEHKAGAAGKKGHPKSLGNPFGLSKDERMSPSKQKQKRGATPWRW